MHHVNIQRGLARTSAGYVHYRCAGKGPAVIVLHINQQSSALCVEIVAALAARYHAVAFDYPGHGASDHVEGDPSIASYASWILEAMQELGIARASVVGEAIGAAIAIELANASDRIEKLVLVDDCGVVINPMIVEGQIHGGVAQGLGEATREQMLYSEDGQVQTGTLMNYAIMRAADMPPMMLGETITPNPFNPLGVKGVGECGTNGAPPAVANAVMDALAPLGIDHVDMPYTAPKLWEIICQAEAKH